MSQDRANDPCRNCGGLKFTHINMNNFIGKTIDDATYDALMAEAMTKYNMYGNWCLNFKLDNLRYLEEVYNSKTKKV